MPANMFPPAEHKLKVFWITQETHGWLWMWANWLQGNQPCLTSQCQLTHNLVVVLMIISWGIGNWNSMTIFHHHHHKQSSSGQW
jgi:hypothetical protein